MFRFISDFQEASRETKWFAATFIFLAIVVVASTFYAFGRLDSVRSYKTPPTKTNVQESNK